MQKERLAIDVFIKKLENKDFDEDEGESTENEYDEA